MLVFLRYWPFRSRAFSFRLFPISLCILPSVFVPNQVFPQELSVKFLLLTEGQRSFIQLTFCFWSFMRSVPSPEGSDPRQFRSSIIVENFKLLSLCLCSSSAFKFSFFVVSILFEPATPQFVKTSILAFCSLTSCAAHSSWARNLSFSVFNALHVLARSLESPHWRLSVDIIGLSAATQLVLLERISWKFQIFRRNSLTHFTMFRITSSCSGVKRLRSPLILLCRSSSSVNCLTRASWNIRICRSSRSKLLIQFRRRSCKLQT